MSFKLGTFDTDEIEGFKAILTEMPALPVELSLDEIAGDGSLFYRARMTETEWVFNLELTGTDVFDVLAKADQISAALNPLLAGGEQDFTPNALDPWVWQGVLGGAIRWERDKVLWFSDQGISRLAGQATIVTPNPYGYAVGDPVVLSGDGSLVLSSTGNTSFYPIVEFRGVLSASQTFSAAGVAVTGPLTAGQTLVLDFDAMDFYIKTTATGAKVRNVADRFTSFRRLEGMENMTIPVSISGGTFTQAVGRVRSRRI
ncbi:minor tail protein [Microbacterium phage Cheeto1]|nr:minor tail protein [Microbacterium phage Cheeto1]